MKRILITFALLLSISSIILAQQEKKILTDMLEEFCQKYYNNCFSGRSYASRTIIVDDYEKDNNVLSIKGKHSYHGSFGAFYEDVDFYASFTITSSYITIEFFKYNLPDYTHSKGYYESCTETVKIE